jgi:hypothetical protein
MDTELGALRRSRWEKAFENGEAGSGKGGSSFLGKLSPADGDDPQTSANRKATIVLEHLIQVIMSRRIEACHLVVTWSLPSPRLIDRLQMWPTPCSIGMSTGNG